MWSGLRKLTIPFFLLFLTTVPTYGQKDYRWEDAPQRCIDFPDEFAKEDAFIVEQSEERQTYIENSAFNSRNIFRKRVKILSPRGLDLYGKIVIPRKDGMFITILDARTLKKGGNVVDLEADQIKSIEYTPEYDLYNFNKYYLFSIPGLEVGDEFEMICIQEGTTIETGGNIYLHNMLPTLKSSFILDVQNNIPVFSSNYNEMPEPKVTENLNTNKLVWQLENLPGYFDERGAIIAEALPYFIYELNLDKFYTDATPPNLTDWRALLSYLNKQFLSPKIRSRGKFEKMIKKIVGTKDLSQIEQLEKIHNYINTNVTIQQVSNQEQSLGVEYFLENKKADFYFLFKIYNAILEQSGLNYYLASAKDRYMGSIQLDFPTAIQITDLFYVVELPDGKFHLLFPKSRSRSYVMDEVPPQLEGSDVYMLNLADGETFKKLNLPKSNYKKNLRRQLVRINYSKSDNNCTISCKESLSGAFSTSERFKYKRLKEQEALEPYLAKQIEDRFPNSTFSNYLIEDKSSEPPFLFGLNFNYELEELFTRLDENLYKLPIEQWINHQLCQVSEKRMLDYCPLYTSGDIITIGISSDKPIELKNGEDLSYTITNEIGSYKLEVKQINPTNIIFSSQYMMKADRIGVEQIGKLSELNAMVEKARRKELIIRI